MGRAPALLACAAFLLAGCAATPEAALLRGTPVPTRTLEGAPPLRDGRAEFRATFCGALRADGLLPPDDAGCDRWLWRLPDEPDLSAQPAAASVVPGRIAVFLVTGAFSECVDPASRPFADGAARLRAGGAQVETIVVGGRSGTEHNARQIAESLGQVPLDGGSAVILIGYSKGALDILRFMVDFPQVAGRVDAVVSVASPVFGTPLADAADPAYSTLLARLPYEKCPPGDGRVISSLSPATATAWLRSNALPAGARYYSLAGFTTRERVARTLVPSWKYLSRNDARNDGQVVASDAVIPGATLLGYANADHWGIAQTIETVHPVLVAREDPARFPLEQLFLAIVQFVAADLARDNGSKVP